MQPSRLRRTIKRDFVLDLSSLANALPKFPQSFVGFFSKDIYWDVLTCRLCCKITDKMSLSELRFDLFST